MNLIKSAIQFKRHQWYRFFQVIGILVYFLYWQPGFVLSQEWTTSGTDIHNANSGKVGIGTTSPTTKLQVIGPDATSGSSWKFEFFSGYAGNYLTQRIGFGYDASGATFGAAIMTTGTTRLWVGDDGKVGIGRTNPGAKLDVLGASGVPNMTNALGRFEDSVGSGLNVDIGGVNNSYGWIRAYTSGVGEKNLSLQPNGGNVGIGTTNPQEQLHVTGNVRVDGNLLPGIRTLQNGYLHLYQYLPGQF